MALVTNIVSYWKLDTNSADSVGTNNGTDTAITYVAGKINNASSFNGTTSQISLPNLGVFGGTARTISLWLNSNDVSIIRELVGWGPSSGLFEDSCSMFSGVFGSDIYWSFDTNDYYTGAVIANGSWYHIVGVYDGGVLSTTTVHIYVNGIAQTLTKAGTGTGAANTTDVNYSIGYDKNSTGRNANGLIDEVGVWSRALTSAEVSELYNGGVGLSYPFTPSAPSNNAVFFGANF